MISNMIFDMGGVLIRWNPWQMLTAFQLTQEEKEILNQELFHSVEWIQQDRGVLSAQGVVDAVCPRVPQTLCQPVQELVFHWHQRYLEPMPGMAELVRELKEQGYGIYLLSNASVALRSYFSRIPGSECFDGLLVSAEEGLLKPGREIYQRLCQRFGLEPGECWFIDDSPANVEGAIYAGLQGTVFRGDVNALRRALRQGGIRCEEGESNGI